MSVVKLEKGKSYVFGSLKGFKPVRVVVGQVNDATELQGLVQEPVISMSITSMRDGMPVLGFAPFYLSAVMFDPVQKIEAFDMPETTFPQQYLAWRANFAEEIVNIWDVGPAEVYHEAIRNLMSAGKNITAGKARKPS